MNNQSVEKPEDEISLIEIIDFFREGWKPIVLSGLLGGLLGITYGLVSSPKYQAIANIQVAKVTGVDVEAPAVLVEKLKMPMYYTQITLTACNLENADDIANILKPTLSKNAPIISISFKERSAEGAKKCLEGVLNEIHNNQNTLIKPILETENNKLTKLKQKLESAEKILRALPTKNTSFDFPDPKTSVPTLLLATRLYNVIEVKDLQSQITDLEAALAEPQTKETFLTTPIYAQTTHAEPKRILIVLLGGVIGGVIAAAFLFGRRLVMKVKSSSKDIQN